MNVSRPRIPRVVVRRHDRRRCRGLRPRERSGTREPEISPPSPTTRGIAHGRVNLAGSEAVPFPDGQGRLVAADRLDRAEQAADPAQQEHHRHSDPCVTGREHGQFGELRQLHRRRHRQDLYPIGLLFTVVDVRVRSRSTAVHRERLLDAADRLMWLKGYEAVGVAELCEVAGNPRGSFYTGGHRSRRSRCRCWSAGGRRCGHGCSNRSSAGTTISVLGSTATATGWCRICGEPTGTPASSRGARSATSRRSWLRHRCTRPGWMALFADMRSLFADGDHARRQLRHEVCRTGSPGRCRSPGGLAGVPAPEPVAVAVELGPRDRRPPPKTGSNTRIAASATCAPASTPRAPASMATSDRSCHEGFRPLAQLSHPRRPHTPSTTSDDPQHPRDAPDAPQWTVTGPALRPHINSRPIG